MRKIISIFSILVILTLTGCQLNNLPDLDITASPDSLGLQQQLALATITPTSTPTAIPLLTPSMEVIDFPQWLKNPITNILAYRKQDEDGNMPLAITFLNPDTAEQFEIETPEFTYFFWHDSQSLILVQGDCKAPDQLTIVDTNTGSINQYTYQDSPVKEIKCLFESSPDRYQTDIKWDENFEGYAVLIDTQTGGEKTFTIPGDGIYDGRAYISPNNKYIVILQSKNPDMLEGPGPAIADRIEVYTINDGNLVMTINEEIGMTFDMFYPDNDEKFIVLRKNTPCIIEIDNQQKKCILNITNTFPDSSIYLGYFTNGEKKLGFIYANHNSGGLCFYDLFTGDISCPTSGLSLLEDHYLISYQLSPDQQYILLLYGFVTPLSDAGGPSGRAIIKSDGSNFVDLGLGADFIWTWIQAQWRPLQ